MPTQPGNNQLLRYRLQAMPDRYRKAALFHYAQSPSLASPCPTSSICTCHTSVRGARQSGPLSKSSAEKQTTGSVRKIFSRHAIIIIPGTYEPLPACINIDPPFRRLLSPKIVAPENDPLNTTDSIQSSPSPAKCTIMPANIKGTETNVTKGTANKLAGNEVRLKP